MLAVEDLTFAYGKNVVLDRVNLLAPSSKITGVVGVSGAGKTTFLRALMLLGVGSSGRIRYPAGGLIEFGSQSKTLVDSDLINIRRSMSFVPQRFTLFPFKSAVNNITFALKKGRGVTGECAENRAAAAMRNLDVSEYQRSFPWQLSGGQQQRVALARALATHDTLVMFDEPTASLDAGNANRFGESLQNFVARHNSVAIVVTHNLGFARKYCDQVCVLSERHLSPLRDAAAIDWDALLEEII